MSYLLQIFVGPVQDFIAATRRTRDLWFRSMMLSEIAKAAALDVKANGGNLIFHATLVGEHRNFSQQLSGFALEARKIVNDNEGVCVYTGGYDLMAFNKALDCARSLHNKFSEILKDFPGTSLFVGISIAHSMENLGLLLDYAQEAEGIAKKGINGQALKQGKDRNGLAITVRLRGNIPFVVREQ